MDSNADDFTSACAYNRDRCDFSAINPGTRRVHLAGRPAGWVIEEILRRAPALEELHLPPANSWAMPEEAKCALAARGVRVTLGTQPRRYLTGKLRNRYEGHRRFFLNLDNRQRAAFDELLALDLKWPKRVARYLCLGGEDRVTADVILAADGISLKTRGALSAWCAAIRRYLDPRFSVGKEAALRLRGLRWRVEHCREQAHWATIEGAWAETFRALGVSGPPAGMPQKLLPAFTAVVEAERDGRLGALGATSPRQARVLRLHYGLEDGRHHTLEEIAEDLGGLTRERVRQIEAAALGALQDDRPPPPEFPLPRGLPRRLEGTYEIVASARGDGRLSSLSGEQADVVRLRYGLDDGQFRAHQEVAAILGVALATVRYRERNAIERLHNSA